MRIAVTGSQGQLGRALQRSLVQYNLLPLSRAELEITDLTATLAVIEGFRPDIVVHAAAATNVDGCETTPEEAYRVNALGTRNLAVAAARVGAALVYVSTNYVFDGLAAAPYHEYAPTNPISVYGASKLAGEGYARDLSAGRYYIVRTTWVYAEQGRNLVRTILRLANERPRLQFVNDQFGQPTYATDLAQAIATLIQQPAYGVYHLTNAGGCSPYELAQSVLQLTGRTAVALEAIPAAAFPRPARPPANGLLHNWAGQAMGVTLRPWEMALADCLRQIDVGSV